MKPKTTTADVGVIVARFQVHNLSDAHRDLLETVASKHSKVLVFLGNSPLFGTKNNPLDFEARKQMLTEFNSNLIILYIKDNADDLTWSKELDKQIRNHLLPNQTAMLYGGRNSFIEHYLGNFSVTELESKVYISGTELRKDISSRVKASSDFRAGVIWAASNRYALAQPTVDIIIYNEDRTRVILVRRNGETTFRFPGGYAEPNTKSYELDACREILEETGVSTARPVYIGSTVIDDWRYRNETDKIKTLVFEAQYLFGPLKPTDEDEIAEVKWFSLQSLFVCEVENVSEIVAKEHHVIATMYANKITDSVLSNVASIQ